LYPADAALDNVSATLEAGIDCSCVAKPERTGVARYCASLLAELPGALGPDDRVRQLYRASRWRKRRWFERVADPRFRTRWFHDGRARFGMGGLDVVHGPDLRIPRVRGVPSVSTVHDLSALDVPGIADDAFKRGKLAALADVADRASVIVCVSEFTERSFLGRFPSARGRTRVVPEGLPKRFGPQKASQVESVLAKRGLSKPYVLFVGQIAARKNLMPVLRAFEALRSRAAGKDLSLVLAGPVQTGGEAVVDAARASPHAAAIRLLGYVTDDELPALYAGAAAFVFPGKGEGFGIPILEAMACGTPVVVADAGANPGTAGDAAVAVDPDSPDAFAAAIERLLADAAWRDTLVEMGRRRAAQFTWAETARLTVAAYRDAIRAGAPA
jgi:glycosyltransferase involved in cell wall biosynthesis